MTQACSVKLGDVVEFEIGSKVRVDEIEYNWPAGHYNDSSGYGRSLVFGCTVLSDNGEDCCPTVYVRRELSPLSGSYVVR